MGIDKHEHDQGDEEHDCKRDGDAIEVLLDDARPLVAVERARYHVRNARAFTRMQQDGHDKARARNCEQNQKTISSGFTVHSPLRFQ